MFQMIMVLTKWTEIAAYPPEKKKKNDYRNT